MRNTIVCPNCNHPNPFHRLTCESCGAYIRERIVNIDFWKIFWKLIETPLRAFREIIHSEHKNLVGLISLLVFIEISLNSYIYPHLLGFSLLGISIVHFIFVAGGFFIGVPIYFLVFEIIAYLFKVSTRYKDIFAVYIYSLVPYLILLFLVFIIKYAIFGKLLFTFEPSPFLIKEFAAYFLFILEGVILLWSIIISIVGTYALSRNLLFSILLGVIFQAFIFGITIFPSIF